jgi:NAD(P)-dependent dehydrogenase (short-subunit alcohol dehydrogenase family)
VSTPTAIVIGVGAQRGLGAAICRRFAAERYQAFVAGRTTEKIEHLVRTIVETGGRAEPGHEKAAGASKAKDEGVILLSEAPGEDVSFGQGLAQRAFIS